MKLTLHKSPWLNVLMLVCTMLIGNVSGAWAETYKLQQVTNVSAGGLYVFEQTYNGTSYVISNSISSNGIKTTSSYIQTGLEGTESYVWTLETATNGFYLRNVSLNPSQYLNNSSGTNMTLGNKSSVWAFNFQEDNTVLIQNTSNGNRFLGLPSSSGTVTTSYYRAYATSNLSTYPHAIIVYQLVEDISSSSCSAPNFTPAAGAFTSAQSVTISCATEGATIYYTTDGTDPTDESNVYSTAINVSKTTTIKAIAVAEGYDNSSIASATYNIVQPLTTMDEIYTSATNAGSTATSAAITFNNWVVTGVKSNNAYVTDGTKGFIVYGSGHNFTTGDVLTGTAICKVQLFNGSAEITDLTKSTSGLTVTDGGTVTPVTNYSIADLSGINTGAVFSFENLAYDGTNLSDGTNTIKPYTTLFSGTFVSGKSYNVTGVYLQYTDTKEILPRSAEDIIELGDDPIEFNDISDITEVNTGYRVKGTVVATNNKGLVLGDGTGYVYYYNNAAVTQSVGDIISIYGNSATYGQILQFTNSATVAAETESNYNNSPAATVITQVPDYTEGYHLSTYLQFEGTLSKENNSYFITLGESQIQISYPTTEQGTTMTALDGKTVLVKGYFTGINSSSKFTVMLESIEEMVSTDPAINASDVILAYNATFGEIAYAINNPVAGTSLTATLQEGVDWISEITVGESSLTFTTTTNEGSEDRTATITLAYEGAESVTVTVTQNHYIADYAELPFEFDGGKADIESTDGLTQDGLDTDYGSSPKLKFNTTGDYLLLHFNERPGTLTFDIKGNGFSNGTFTVQTSADGETFSDFETYTTLGEVQSEEFSNLDENVRFIKWIYTEKSEGNVALGNIKLAEYVAPVNYTLTIGTPENVTITATYYGNEVISNGENAQILNGTEVTLALTIPEGYILGTLTVEGEDGQAVTYKENSTTEGVYSFNMPSYNITINATVTAITGDPYNLFSGELEEGDYIIYYGGKAMNNTVSSDRLQYAEVTPVNHVITTDNEAIVWHIAKSGGYWTIYNEAANAYASSTGAKNKAQMLEDGTDDKALWTVSGTETFEFVNKANTAAGINAYLRNNDTYGFACYASSTGGALSLYKKSPSATLLGDVNKDGSITIADVTALVNIILGKDTEGQYDHKAADVNTDGSVTIADVTALVNIILGKTTTN